MTAIRARKGRYEFLDALRGIGASAVVLQHAAELIWPSYLRWSIEVFRPGEYGVIVFFLVSGFIIPASSERYESLKGFWTGRFFRLFPIYWVFVGAALVLHSVHRYPLPHGLTSSKWVQVPLNFTMVQQFTGSHDKLVIGASWTLAYELCFYLFISLLFVAKLHKRPLPIAVALFGLAGAVGGFVPSELVRTARHQHSNGFAVVCLVGLCVVFFASRASTNADRIAAVAISVVVVSLVANQPDHAWFTLLLFATMFLGSVMYRVTAGELDPLIGWAVFAGGVAMAIVINRAFVTTNRGLAGALQTWRPEALTFAAAYLTFGAALLLRDRRWPRPLLFLGLISYSLYLVHALVIASFPKWSASAAHPFGLSAKLLTYLTWLLVCVVVSTATYYAVERPAQNLGHKLSRRNRLAPPTIEDDRHQLVETPTA